MKKTTKKLALHRETLSELERPNLLLAGAATRESCAQFCPFSATGGSDACAV